MDVTGPPLAGCAGDPCRAAGTAPAGLPGCEAVPGPQSAGPGPARALRPELAEIRAKKNVESFMSLAVKFIACSVIQPVLLTGSQCSNPDLNCCDNTPV